jgi:uncharacterized protein (DUF1499 family)
MSNLVGASVVIGVLILLGQHYWLTYAAPEDTQALKRYLVWAGRGLALPLVFWTVLNAGLGSWLAPLTAEVHWAKYGGKPWGEVLARALAPGWLSIGFFWAATTFTWLLIQLRPAPECRRDLIFVGIVWGILPLPAIWFILRAWGLAGLGAGLLAWLWPLAHFTLPFAQQRKILPCYSRAIARMKFGKYTDAESEVIAQLEKSEEDFDGWLMLADLYANQFHDLRAADRTILDLCDQPNVTSIQTSIAWHRLADWHLKLADDPDGARWALEEICVRLPGTTFAREARMRASRLPASPAELREQREVKPIRLPPLNDELEEAETHPEPEYDRAETLRLVNQCVAQLTQNPNDVPKREKLALLFAERLHRPELGIEQLELLLGMPEQPPQKAAHWLSQIAAWHIKYRKDSAAAKPLLERLIRDFPRTAQAFSAQRKLNLLEMELLSRKS